VALDPVTVAFETMRKGQLTVHVDREDFPVAGVGVAAM
jgi:hypothetical protein